MTITTTLMPPSRGGAPATFSADMDAFLSDLPAWTTEANALQADVNSKQSTASTAATNAANSASAASTSATNAANSASAASTSATNAANSASAASTSATNAANSASAASTSATNAANSASAAAASAASITWTSPGAIGSTTPNSGAFTTLSATGNATIGDAEATDTHAINGATTVLANSASPAMKVTQAGSGNAFVVEDAASDATPFVIDSAGNVGIGATPTYDLDISKTKTGTALVSRVYNAGTGAGSEASLRVVQGTVSGTISAQGDSVLYIGASSNHPVVLLQNSAEVLRISTAKEVLVTNPAGLGYGTGAGGTVTQATSKSTAVTLNKPCGQITMNNAALAAGASVYFSLVNSLIGSADTLAVHPVFFTGTLGNEYEAWVSYLVAGQAVIGVRNNTAGSRSDELLLNFAVIKGSTA